MTKQDLLNQLLGASRTIGEFGGSIETLRTAVVDVLEANKEDIVFADLKNIARGACIAVGAPLPTWLQR